MSINRLNSKEFLEVISTRSMPLYLYGNGNMCQELLSGSLDVLFQKVHFWKEEVKGIIDQKAQTKLDISQSKPLYTPKQFMDNEGAAVILLCTGVAKRHRDGYQSIITSLDNHNSEYFLITVYDLMTDKYYREDLGIFEAAGICKVLDMPTYLASAPWYFYKVFDQCQNYSYLDAKNIEKWISNCSEIMTKSKQIGIRDVRSDYFNVINGRRLIPVSAGNYQNRIHIFGDSRILSIRTSDEDTIESYLQKKLTEDNEKDYRVLNYGMPMFNLERLYYQISHAHYEEGDIIVVGGGIKQTLVKHAPDLEEILLKLVEISMKNQVKVIFLHCPCIYELNELTYIEQFILDAFLYLMTPLTYAQGQEWSDFMNSCIRNDIEIVDMSEYSKMRSSYGEIYIDTQHYGPNGNRWIADRLYWVVRAGEKKQPYKINVDKSNCLLDKSSCLLEKSIRYAKTIEEKAKNNGLSQKQMEHLRAYLKNCEEQIKISNAEGEIGAIVMNCNPFTLGHRYLIETAAALVKHLVVFVVEENKSYFDIKDRFFLVKEGCKDLENVSVVLSGKFIISSTTFPEYFCKDTLGDTYIDSSADLSLFGEYIAPYLGITRRFVGEEPFDLVTRQYNEMMKEVLEDYGVRVTEIPRKEMQGSAISASRVRKLLEINNLQKIKQLVPEVTFDYLLANYDKRWGNNDRT